MGGLLHYGYATIEINLMTPYSSRTPKKDPSKWQTAVKVAAGLMGLSAFSLFVFYRSGPDIQPIAAVMECPECDNGGGDKPPATFKEANTGTKYTVKLKNSSTYGADVLDHNLSIQSSVTPSDLKFIETPDPEDKTPIHLGAESFVYLSIERGATNAYIMRNADRIAGAASKEHDYLFGHITYTTNLGFSKTTQFCFLYHPPSRGFPESWSVCDAAIFPPK
jgi:hypothetical protein